MIIFEIKRNQWKDAYFTNQDVMKVFWTRDSGQPIKQKLDFGNLR